MLSFEEKTVIGYLTQILKRLFPDYKNFFPIHEWEPDWTGKNIGCLGAEVHADIIINLVMITKANVIQDTNGQEHKNKVGDVFLQFFDPIPNPDPVNGPETNITHKYVSIISDPNIEVEVGKILEARKQGTGVSRVLVPKVRDEDLLEHSQ